jgi:hypothetical protein
MSESSASGGGIGFCGLLTIVFIALKLLGKVTWSWWWILSPSWLPIAILLGIFAIVVTMELIAGL